MDQKDLDFLEEIKKELLRIDPNTYKAKAEELENIIYRSIIEKNQDIMKTY